MKPWQIRRRDRGCVSGGSGSEGFFLKSVEFLFLPHIGTVGMTSAFWELAYQWTSTEVSSPPEYASMIFMLIMNDSGLSELTKDSFLNVKTIFRLIKKNGLRGGEN